MAGGDEKVHAFRSSAEYKKTREIGDKYAKFRSSRSKVCRSKAILREAAHWGGLTFAKGSIAAIGKTRLGLRSRLGCVSSLGSCLLDDLEAFDRL
jgi:hypothetical protein